MNMFQGLFVNLSLRACLHGVGDPGLVGLVSFVSRSGGHKTKKNGKKMLPSTLDLVPSPSTWNPRPSTLDKKIDSLEPQSKTIGVDSLRNYNSHKYSTNAPFNGAFALKSTLQLVIILAKTTISPIFRNFCRNRSFCWTPLYLL